LTTCASTSPRPAHTLDGRALSNTAGVQVDPFGLAPCYYRQAGPDPRHSHHLASFRRSEPLDPAAILQYLCCSYVLGPRTIFSGTSQIRPGSVLTADGGLRDPEPWTEQATAQTDERDLVSQLRELLRCSVRNCLAGESEVGVFLSGGLDSSLVAALLCEAGAKVHLFALDFGAPWNAELEFARQVAEQLRRPLRVVPAGPREISGSLNPTAAALEQPFGDPVTVPLYLLGRAASDYCRTIFNGEGGDQLFGGWANKPMIAAEAYAGASYDRLEAYMATFHRFWGSTATLLTADALQATRGSDPREPVRAALEAPRCHSLLHRLRAANLAIKGAYNIAPRAVQLGTACGLRVCAPFFDRTLADWTFSLPPEVFLQGACEKYVLKQASDFLPEEVVWREKRGMGVPVTEWLLGPLKRETGCRLSRGRLKRDGWFRPEAIEALRRGEDIEGEIRGRRVGEKLWLLLMLHAWIDQRGLTLPKL
jgi:asparagine synthase (glutamine-hydrolysing)